MAHLSWRESKLIKKCKQGQGRPISELRDSLNADLVIIPEK